MESVGLVTNQSCIVNHSSPTGHTVNYPDNISIHYVRVGVFAKLNGISERHLKRYREEIVTDKLVKDHRFYFHNTGGIFYYNEKILELRKYQTRGAKKTKEVKEIDHSVQPFTQGLLHRIKQHKWDFACGVRYWREHEIEECVQRIKQANEELVRRFPDAKISMFFTTEKNPDNNGYHNHLVFSFNGIKAPAINQIKKLLCTTGTLTPWVDVYDTTDNYIDYIVKDIHLFPDGWQILTNSQSDFRGFISGLEDEPLFVSSRNKKWQEEALKWH